MDQVVKVLYLMELVFCGVIGTLVAITAWVVWALHGQSRLLNMAEQLLPLKGRWLRYLVGVALLPLVAAAPITVCLNLWAKLPEFPGSLVLTAVLILLAWHAFSVDAQREAERSRTRRAKLPLPAGNDLLKGGYHEPDVQLIRLQVEDPCSK